MSVVLTCVFCSGSVKKPDLLKCLHVSCQKCVEEKFSGKVEVVELAEGGEEQEVQVSTLSCPACHLTMTREEMLEDLFSEEEPRMCGPCLEGGENIPAVVSCRDCPDLLCQRCVEAHKRVKLTRSHQLVDGNI